jgi:hypothetical protein
VTGDETGGRCVAVDRRRRTHRGDSATSLAEIDPARAFDPLVAALDDPDPQVSRAG